MNRRVGARLLGAVALWAMPGLVLAALGPLAGIAQRYAIPSANISAVVADVDGGPPILAVNPRAPRNPASTLKLITTYVALDTLGPVHTWRTELYALGPVRGDTLEGDLLVKGYGDPYLIEENVWKMLGELRRTGVRHITGDLVIDDTYFAPPAREPGDFDGQPYRLYNVLPNALMVNFKAVTFVFTPYADRVQVTTLPELPNLQGVNELRPEQGRCRGVLQSVQMTVPDPVRADRVLLNGRYAAGCGRQTLPRSLLTPDAYAYGLIKRLWSHWGGTLDGGVRRAARPPHARRLVTWHSPPLAELIRPLNKWSNNVMADAVFLALGAELFDPPLMPGHGAAAVKSYLRAHRIPAEGLVLENGSGLSRITRVSAQTMHDLLRHAYHGRFMPEFMASMSIVGIDGTLRRRLKRSAERGWMHLKTGHLNNVAAVAGYVRGQSGRTYSVVLFVNGPTNGADALIDTFLKWTYRQ